MADVTRREVEFLVRARDQASGTFDDVSKAVNRVTDSLEKQIDAASRGEISSKELRSSYQQLERAGQSLTRQQALIDYHRRVADNLELAEAKARDAKTAQEAYSAELAAGDNVTKRQEQTLARLTRATEQADKRVESLRGTLAAQVEKLNQAGIETDNLAASQRRLLDTADKVGDAITRAQVALDGYDENLRRVKASQGALADAKTLADFRKIGDVATENANRVRASSAAIAGDAETVAGRLRAMVDPSGSARETLAGLTAEVERLNGVVGNADKPMKDYQDSIYELGQAQRAILGQAGLIDDFRSQEAAVGRVEARVDAAKAQVLQYAAAVSSADEPNDELARSLRQAEAALASENRELDVQQRKLESLRGSLKRAGIDVRDLAGAERQLEAASQTSAAALGRLDTAASGRGTRAGRFLGLRPYELTNLGYQVNDIFTQIASGTSVTQTLAQQGGQLIQIFPRAFGAMVAFIPELAALAAVVISVGAAIKNANDEAASTRQFAGALELMADGGLYNAESLAEQAHQLDVWGGSLEDARAQIRSYISEGLNPDYIERFGLTAENIARITGEDVPDAARKLAEGFTGGWEQVRALDDELQVLSASEREQIRLMFESGDAAEARTRAYEIFEDAANRAAEQARGPWSEAFRSLTQIWDSFLESLGNSAPIRGAIDILDELADAAVRAAGGVRGLPTAAGGGGLPGGVPRRPDVDPADWLEGYMPGDPQADAQRQFLHMFRWTRPGWMGGDGGPVDVTPEIRDIVATVMLEAIDDPQAQRDVAAVILNRMQRSGQSGSEVVRARGQFEPVFNRRREWEAITPDMERFQRALENILPILEGTVQDPTGGATLFVSPGGQRAMGRDMPEWATPDQLTLSRYGHQFYRGAFPGDRGGSVTPETLTERQRIVDAERLRQLTEEIALRDRSNHALRLEVAAREAREAHLAGGGSEAGAADAAALARAGEQARIDQEIAREAEQEARRTEAERRRLQGLTDAVRSDLRQLEGQVQRTQDQSLEQRLAAIDTRFAGIEQNITEAEAASAPGPEGMSWQQVREVVEANKEILRQQETMAFYADQIDALEEQRQERLGAIAEDLAAGNVESAAAFEQALAVNEELAPAMREAATQAIAFATALRTAEPNPQLEAFIAAMQRIAGRETGAAAPGSPVAQVGTEQLREAEGELNRIISERNELIQNYVALVDLGRMTTLDAQQRTAEAYRLTEPLIGEQVERINELIAALHEAGVISDATFSSWQTRLEVISEEAIYVDENFRQIKNTLTEGFADTITSMFDTAASSIVDAANGTIEWGDALENVWRAAVAGAASLLKSLGEILLKIALMKAIENLPIFDSLTGDIMDFTGLTVGAAATAASAAALDKASGKMVGGAAAIGIAALALDKAASKMMVAAAVNTASKMLPGGVKHAGGVVGAGSSNTTRPISSWAFQGAPRHHDGTLVGLRNDEYAAILKRNEEVLRDNDPRNILNGGAPASGWGAAGGRPSERLGIRQVLLMDPNELAGAMAGSAGEDVVLTHIRVNAPTIRQILNTGG